MEIFNPSHISDNFYRSTINQSGRGTDIDRYIYSSQSGEGIGSFFGNLVRTVVPFLGSAIKGASNIAKPYIKGALKDILTTGTKRAVNKISGPIIHKKHKKHKKQKQRKWQSL